MGMLWCACRGAYVKMFGLLAERFCLKMWEYREFETAFGPVLAVPPPGDQQDAQRCQIIFTPA